ncbi:hypothetical protein HWB39_gp08 [Streptomyces phage WRightOn]|uniref:Uncharacterized protein n=1 Tax=Streptomyces phage WRightOn TaxID=2053723 RepID=A0A2H4PI93_9CAUD|nr:hypothetical protein HWB39_gp08 [Streptomyces phage WRightOn]ATW62465.1 hypothetical protein SEA_WRIGHTON_8 [Streptomyces phage WRightOn]
MAEVSGPGKFSERTDKAVSAANNRLPNAGYGEQADYQEQKSAAPEAKSPGGNVDFASLFGDPASRVVPLNAPSGQPGVPITDGAAMGAGAGMEALGLQDQRKVDLEGLAPYIPVLEFMANQPGASWAMRNVVRKVKALQ